MFIKKIESLDYNDGEFVISDGINEIKGTCVSLPMPDDKKPFVGMNIISLKAFFFDTPEIKIIRNTKDQNYLIKKINKIYGMDYKVQGIVIDEKNFLVKVYDFIVSLEYEFGDAYCDNKEFKFKNGDWLSFVVDRFDIFVCDDIYV